MHLSNVGDQANVDRHPVELLQNLIRFNTTNPPGNEGECINYISNLLNEGGIETTILALDPKRPNLIARLSGRGCAPPLLLYGHVDVATTENQTWQYPPFEGRLVGDYVWGRGALDMKGGIAMMLAAILRAKAENLTMPGDVILAVLSDEESGTINVCGAKYLVDNHAPLFKDCKYAVGEFGGFSFRVMNKCFYPIMVAEKQVCVIEATIRGASGHPLSAIVQGGTTAKLGHMLKQLDTACLPIHITPVVRQMCEKMSSSLPFPANLLLSQVLNPRLTKQILKLLDKQGRVMEPIFRNTICATLIQSGEAGRTIPGKAVAILVGGLLPGYGPGDLISELKRFLGNDIELNVLNYNIGPSAPDMKMFPVLVDILRELDTNGVPVPMLLTAITDGRIFSELGIQTYGFLPMKLPPGFDFVKLLHGADERIPVEALTFGTEAIYKLLQRFDT